MRKCGMRAARWAVAACAVLSACSPQTDRPDTSKASAPASERSSSTGSLRGTVRLGGTRMPDPVWVENTIHPEVCDPVQPRGDLLVHRESRGIANVIVSLRGLSADKIPLPQPGRLVLDNRECEFVPRAAVLTVGSTIEAVSDDPVLHTAHFYGALEFNIALPDETATLTVMAREPGMIVVLCDLHRWMRAYIRVDAHPFHAVTDAEGTFVIENIPAGSYELDVWHERLGTQSLSVRVEPETGAATQIVYELEGL